MAFTFIAELHLLQQGLLAQYYDLLFVWKQDKAGASIDFIQYFLGILPHYNEINDQISKNFANRVTRKVKRQIYLATFHLLISPILRFTLMASTHFKDKILQIDFLLLDVLKLLRHKDGRMILKIYLAHLYLSRT